MNGNGRSPRNGLANGHLSILDQVVGISPTAKRELEQAVKRCAEIYGLPFAVNEATALSIWALAAWIDYQANCLSK